MDNKTSEHMKFASKKLYTLLAICFNGLLVHGILPDSILSVLLEPIIKGKAGKVTSLDIYMLVAIASILVKVLENILLD